MEPGPVSAEDPRGVRRHALVRRAGPREEGLAAALDRLAAGGHLAVAYFDLKPLVFNTRPAHVTQLVLFTRTTRCIGDSVALFAGRAFSLS